MLRIDEDLPLDELPAAWLGKHPITVVTSSPRCLESGFISMLDDAPPARERDRSRHGKRRFHRHHRGTDRESETVANLRAKCPVLFPRSFLEKARPTHPALHSILGFPGL